MAKPKAQTSPDENAGDQAADAAAQAQASEQQEAEEAAAAAEQRRKEAEEAADAAERRRAEAEKATEAALAQQEEARQAAELAADQADSGGDEDDPAWTSGEEDADEASEKQRALMRFVSRLADLSRDDLVTINGFIDTALQNKGQDPASAHEASLTELASVLPLNADETVQVTAEKAAALITNDDSRDNADTKLGEEDVSAFSVRQGTAADGAFIGPKYLIVADQAGDKHTAVL